MSSSRLIASLLYVVIVAPIFAVEPLEESDIRKYDVDADVTLSVENIDGAIRIYGTDKPEVRVQAIKRAYNTERLHGIVVDVKASRKQVAITTSFPPRKNAVSDRSGTVDYIIVVPQTARVTELKLTNGEIQLEGLRPGGSATARLVNGWLGAHNCFANLDLGVETGRLDLAYGWWENREVAIKAAIARGNIRAIFPSDAALNLSAMAPEGKIANGFGSKTAAADVVRSVAEVIGSKAEAAVSFEARRGNIWIHKLNY